MSSLRRVGLAETFLTASEVAARLEVKPSWVYRHADDLGASRLGKYLRFSWVRVLERRLIGSASRGCTCRRLILVISPYLKL